MRITIETIPHSAQRYDTVGDWVIGPGTIDINVSEIKDMVGKVSEDSIFLVAAHELIEAYLCHKAGITTEMVDEFDMNWHEEQFSRIDEPGNDPRAPYHVQHLVAQSIEMMLCAQLGKEWSQHCKDVEAVK